MTFLLCMGLALGQAADAQATAGRDRAVQLAIETLSKQIGADAKTIQVRNAAPAEWKDSSLGCPERGMIYTPALVSGFKVTLQVADREYDVHTGGGHAVVCGGSSPASKAPVIGAVKAALAAAGRSREHLANRLHVPADEVGTKLARPWLTSDGRCDPPGERKTIAATYFVELTHNDRSYRYRASADAVWPCGSDARPPG